MGFSKRRRFTELKSLHQENKGGFNHWSAFQILAPKALNGDFANENHLKEEVRQKAGAKQTPRAQGRRNDTQQFLKILADWGTGKNLVAKPNTIFAKYPIGNSGLEIKAKPEIIIKTNGNNHFLIPWVTKDPILTPEVLSMGLCFLYKVKELNKEFDGDFRIFDLRNNKVYDEFDILKGSRKKLESFEAELYAIWSELNLGDAA